MRPLMRVGESVCARKAARTRPLVRVGVGVGVCVRPHVASMPTFSASSTLHVGLFGHREQKGSEFQFVEVIEVFEVSERAGQKRCARSRSDDDVYLNSVLHDEITKKRHRVSTNKREHTHSTESRQRCVNDLHSQGQRSALKQKQAAENEKK